jgi:hypothetical protein
MCPRCPIITAATKEANFQECHEALAQLIAGFEFHSKSAKDMEDLYRTAGLHYHRTQLAARRDSNFHPSDLVVIEALFELTHVKDYNFYFAQIDTLFAAMEDLKSTHFRFNGTVKQLYHRVFHVLKPGFDDLDAKLRPKCKTLLQIFKLAGALKNISRLLYETDEQGRRIAWHASTDRSSLCMTEEWKTFLMWVKSLPETGRMVELGRTAEEVAFEMLFSEPEGFEEDELDAISDLDLGL